MRTTGARDERATSAARERCPRSCTPAVVRPCCCTYCRTEVTSTRQASSTGLLPNPLSQLGLASSSRSQVAVPTASSATCLTWEPLSASVHWRPLLSVVIVTRLVTRPLVSSSHERLLRRSSRPSSRPGMLQLSGQTDLSACDRIAPSLLSLSGTRRARSQLAYAGSPSTDVTAMSPPNAVPKHHSPGLYFHLAAPALSVQEFITATPCWGSPAKLAFPLTLPKSRRNRCALDPPPKPGCRIRRRRAFPVMLHQIAGQMSNLQIARIVATASLLRHDVINRSRQRIIACSFLYPFRRRRYGLAHLQVVKIDRRDRCGTGHGWPRHRLTRVTADTAQPVVSLTDLDNYAGWQPSALSHHGVSRHLA